MCVLINRDLQYKKMKEQINSVSWNIKKDFFFIIHIKDIDFLSLLDDQKRVSHYN